MLNELEPVDDVALVCSEEEATSVDRLPRCVFSWSDFGAKLDAATNDTAVLGGGWFGEIFEIRAGVSLPCMRGEGASVLRRWVIREGVAEVVVLFLVIRNGEVILKWREIDGCSCASPSESIQEANLAEARKTAYRSSNGRPCGPREAHYHDPAVDQG